MVKRYDDTLQQDVLDACVCGLVGLIGVSLLAGLMGCTFDVPMKECFEDKPCPHGYICEHGVCKQLSNLRDVVTDSAPQPDNATGPDTQMGTDFSLDPERDESVVETRPGDSSEEHDPSHDGACLDDCALEGARECFDSGLRVCVRGMDSCLDWEVVPCADGSTCQNGECVTSTCSVPNPVDAHFEVWEYDGYVIKYLSITVLTSARFEDVGVSLDGPGGYLWASHISTSCVDRLGCSYNFSTDKVENGLYCFVFYNDVSTTQTALAASEETIAF